MRRTKHKFTTVLFRNAVLFPSVHASVVRLYAILWQIATLRLSSVRINIIQEDGDAQTSRRLLRGA